jgi:hypothetical protein
VAKAKNPESNPFAVAVFLIAVVFFSTTAVDTISCEGKSGRKLARLHLLSSVWYLRLCLFRLDLTFYRRHYEARTDSSKNLIGWIFAATLKS